jgi:dephospho-CoA kinase
MIVGLTGGIGTGKSTAARFFEECGALVISADKLGHEALSKDGEAYKPVVERFKPILGNKLLLPDGELDRAILRHRVFLNPADLEALNQIVHPVVRSMFHEILKGLEPVEIAVYECAILFEHKIDQEMDFTISTMCPQETQVMRIMQRDHISRPEALQIIEKQMPVIDKARLATWAIFSGPDMEADVHSLYRVLQAIERYKNT